MWVEQVPRGRRVHRPVLDKGGVRMPMDAAKKRDSANTPPQSVMDILTAFFFFELISTERSRETSPVRFAGGVVY